MRAVRVHRTGGPEVLEIEEIPRPVPQRGQVLIRVQAFGLNPCEVYIRGGMYGFRPVTTPFTPGFDCSGIVQELGSDVLDYKESDRVYTTMHTLTGTYAEYVVVQAKMVARLPDGLSFSQGAAVGIPYTTAYAAIHHKAKAQTGETMLVHGASGGVGLAAVQLGRALGLRVVGTAGTEAGIALVRENGADLVFNHSEHGYMDKIKKATEDNGVQIILEMWANVNLVNDVNLVTFRGRIVIIGHRGHVKINPHLIMSKEAVIVGITLQNTPDEDWKELISGVHQGLENGTLIPVISREYKLSEIQQAHRDVLQNEGSRGKLVVKLSHY